MTRSNFLSVILALLVGFGVAYWQPWEFFSTSVEATPAPVAQVPAPATAKARAVVPAPAGPPAPATQTPLAEKPPAVATAQCCCECCRSAKKPRVKAPAPKAPVAPPKAAASDGPPRGNHPTFVCQGPLCK